MSKYVFLAFFFISVVPKSFSQLNLNDFSFVIVPEQFEFLNEKDKYQLNSISKFLYNKHGFHAYFSQEAPNTRRCDGLYADLLKIPSVFKTKFVIVLKDCNGFEVYRSLEGVSKFKEFKKAYQDAMRNAFANFENMNVRQKDIIEYTEDSGSKPSTIEIQQPKSKQVSDSSEMEVVSESTGNSMLPQPKFSSYTYNDKTYLLRKTSEGYSLYEETTNSNDGLLLKGKIEVVTESKIYFTDVSENIFKASFDSSENLSIQQGDTSEVYKRIR